jgi:hypothetical protein
VSITVGEGRTLTATPRDASGNPLTGRSVSWTSGNNGIATVNQNGRVVGAAVGQVTITATVEGESGASAVTVTAIPVDEVDVSPSSASIEIGEQASFTAVPRDASGNALAGRTITWSSTAPGVASVNGSGVVTAVAAGTTTIRAQSEGVTGTASVTVTAPATLVGVEVSPSSVTLQTGSSRNFTAVGRMSDGGTTSISVTWTATGGSVSGAGQYTAGGSAGSYRVVATESGGLADTASVTITAPPTLVAIEVTPPTTTLLPGGTQAFSAVGRMSDGGTSAVSVTWTATGGSVTSSGVYTAGGNAGTYRVVATESGGLADTAQVTIAQQPPTNGVPDLSQLPIANGQQPNVTAWNALNVRNMAGGGSYLDPLTGVRVWKITSASIPTSNSGMGHDYGDGPVQVSGEWGGNKHTILVRGDGYWLVDLERGVGLSNWRQVPNGARPGSDLNWTFSKNPATPQIAYSYSGGQLVRVNTGTNQVQNTGNFPKSMSSGYWLHQDKNDEWFVKMEGAGAVVAWNSVTNQTLRQSFSGLDEPHMEGNGRYVALITDGGTRVWDLQTNTVSSNGWRQWTFHHNASLLGHWISIHVDGPVFNFRLDPNGSSSPTGVNIFEPGMATYQHGAGQWVQRTVPVNQQYAVISSYGNLANGGEIWPGAKLKAAVGFLRSDGGDARILAHTYMVFNSGDYWQMPQATPSPDGKVVIFNSDMQNSNRYDLFLAEVPLR